MRRARRERGGGVRAYGTGRNEPLGRKRSRTRRTRERSYPNPPILATPRMPVTGVRRLPGRPCARGSTWAASGPSTPRPPPGRSASTRFRRAGPSRPSRAPGAHHGSAGAPRWTSSRARPRPRGRTEARESDSGLTRSWTREESRWESRGRRRGARNDRRPAVGVRSGPRTRRLTRRPADRTGWSRRTCDPPTRRDRTEPTLPVGPPDAGAPVTEVDPTPERTDPRPRTPG